MRATSPSGSAAFEGEVAWSGELGFGVRAPEGGQSGRRDDATTGSHQLRDTLERHLRNADLPVAKQGPRGAIGRMMEKAERFAPSAGKKHKIRADAEYAASLAAGNTESALPPTLRTEPELTAPTDLPPAEPSSAGPSSTGPEPTTSTGPSPTTPSSTDPSPSDGGAN
jgi:hypothetical protein